MPRPNGKTNFIVDEANLIAPADVTQINNIAAKLLREKATPILVVTIPSMSAVGGRGRDIEHFARNLFDDWQIGHARLNGQDWNTGMLLPPSPPPSHPAAPRRRTSGINLVD